MGFLDKLGEMVGEFKNDPLSTPGHYLRYGVGPARKQRMMSSGEIPGQPSLYDKSGAEDPEAVRYASQYLSTTGGLTPDWLDDAANSFAFSDLSRTPEESMRVKMGGERGRQRGRQDRSFLSALVGMPWIGLGR
jgi:hypothetical protein